MSQFVIKVLNIIDSRCNHEVYKNVLQMTLYYKNFWRVEYFNKNEIQIENFPMFIQVYKFLAVLGVNENIRNKNLLLTFLKSPFSFMYHPV